MSQTDSNRDPKDPAGGGVDPREKPGARENAGSRKTTGTPQSAPTEGPNPRQGAPGAAGTKPPKDSKPSKDTGQAGQSASASKADGGGKDASAEKYVPPDREAYEMLIEKAGQAELFKTELLKARADLDNYHKRMMRERPNWEQSAVRAVVFDLLPVLDNFERALSSAPAKGGDPEQLLKGVEMIHQMLTGVLESHDVREIQALGESFDPGVHEAVLEQPVEDRETGEILQVHQKGYQHRDVVVRPSRVVVAKNTSEAAQKGKR